MTLFHYKAVTPSGETLEGQMDVASADEVIMKLQDAGNIPLDVRDADSVESGGLLAALMKRPTLSEAQIVQFTQQLLRRKAAEERNCRVYIIRSRTCRKSRGPPEATYRKHLYTCDFRQII